jgi:GAF domain-containing protein
MTDEPLSLDDGLRHLSRLVVRDETMETTLQRIVEVASRAIPDTLGASITLMKGRHPYTAVATNDEVRRIDAREYAVAEGPCLTALESGEVQSMPDAEDEERWPKFVALCRRSGLASALGVPLRIGTESCGAMNLYAALPNAFKDEHQQSARLLAEQAAVAIVNTRTYGECSEKIRQLQEALDSRVIIEQAKGVLMATERVDADAAFTLLRERSQRANRKLRLIADEVVAGVLAPG